ncbi:hypothetical protein HZA33_01640 [Candidatus Pacearchaeota archaeon]|nr:hypothetical protein [Candidatus Pacearchaeota archaeon]
MVRKKRGQAELFPFLGWLVLGIFFLIAFLFFVNSAGKGTNIKEQVLAKKIVMIINEAEPGTAITFPIENFYVSIDGTTLTVKTERSSGYSYDFFSNYNIKPETNGGYLIIKVE